MAEKERKLVGSQVDLSKGVLRTGTENAPFLLHTGIAYKVLQEVRVRSFLSPTYYFALQRRKLSKRRLVRVLFRDGRENYRAFLQRELALISPFMLYPCRFPFQLVHLKSTVAILGISGLQLLFVRMNRIRLRHHVVWVVH